MLGMRMGMCLYNTIRKLTLVFGHNNILDNRYIMLHHTMDERNAHQNRGLGDYLCFIFHM